MPSCSHKRIGSACVRAVHCLEESGTTIEVRDYAFYNDKPEDTQQLLMMYYAVVNDHPDLYYVRTGYKKSYLTSSKLITKISPSYYTDIDDSAFQEGVQRAKRQCQRIWMTCRQQSHSMTILC